MEAVAVSDFQNGEISFRKGDVLHVIDQVNADTWRGRLKTSRRPSGHARHNSDSSTPPMSPLSSPKAHSRRGANFPAAVVKLIPEDEPNIPAKAIKAFESDNPEHLCFGKGAHLTVIASSSTVDWVMAEYHGRRGLVPGNYLDFSKRSPRKSKHKHRHKERVREESSPDGSSRECTPYHLPEMAVPAVVMQMAEMSLGDSDTCTTPELGSPRKRRSRSSSLAKSSKRNSVLIVLAPAEEKVSVVDAHVIRRENSGSSFAGSSPEKKIMSPPKLPPLEAPLATVVTSQELQRSGSKRGMSVVNHPRGRTRAVSDVGWTKRDDESASPISTPQSSGSPPGFVNSELTMAVKKHQSRGGHAERGAMNRRRTIMSANYAFPKVLDSSPDRGSPLKVVKHHENIVRPRSGSAANSDHSIKPLIIPPPPMLSDSENIEPPPSSERYDFFAKDGPDNTYFNKKGELTGATPAKLVAMFTEAPLVREEDDRRKLMHDFVVAYSSFFPPEKMLRLIRARVCDSELDMHLDADVIRANGIVLLREWLKWSYNGDFVPNPDLIRSASSLLKMIHLNKYKFIFGPTTRLVVKQTIQLFNLYHTRTTWQTPPALLTPKDMTREHLPKGIDLMEMVSAEELANQVTLVQFNLFQKISPHECLNKNWTDKSEPLKAPNILRITGVFTDMARWMEESVLLAESNRDRNKLVTYYLRACHRCKELCNFNGMMMFLSAVQTHTITRLKKVWTSDRETLVEPINKMMDHNFRELRKLQDESSPCIPYVGMILTDLTFIDDGNPDYIKDTTLLNWNKMRMCGSVIQKMQIAQTRAFDLAPKREIVKILYTMKPSMDEEQAYEKSLQIQPEPKQKK